MCPRGQRGPLRPGRGDQRHRLLERRRKQTPLRDVAGLLRSLSYISAALRDEGAEVAGWEARARERESDPRREEGLAGARATMAEIFDGAPEFVDLTVVEETAL